MKTWLLRIKLVFVRASDIANAHREGVEQLKSYFGKVPNCQSKHLKGQLGPRVRDVTFFNHGGQLGPRVSNVTFF